MANNFVVLSVVGGSLNTWGTTLNTLLQAGGIGALTAELYNDGGVLKLSKGKIGIDNGVATGIGVAIIDTITTISTAGMTAGLWYAIEMSVSGTAVTLTITPIAGANDESVIDAATKAAYDYEKTGYYLTASKRLLGVVFLRAALALGRIVNCESGKLGFKGIRIEKYYVGTTESIKYYNTIRLEYSPWNMDTTASITLAWPYIIPIARNRHYRITIISNGGDQWDGMSVGSMSIRQEPINNILVARAAGSFLDSALYNAATAIIEMTLET